MTAKQELFIVEYLKDFNALQAALRAGYSKSTALKAGRDLLESPEISLKITEKKAEILENREKIVLENIAFWQEMRTNPKAKDADRLKASEMLGKYAAMFTEKVQVSDPNGEPIQIGITFKHAKEESPSD